MAQSRPDPETREAELAKAKAASKKVSRYMGVVAFLVTVLVVVVSFTNLVRVRLPLGEFGAALALLGRLFLILLGLALLTGLATVGVKWLWLQFKPPGEGK